MISGTPTVLSGVASYAITAKNAGGTATTTIAITVNDVAPSELSYAGAPLVATKGLTIVSLKPASKGGAVTNFSATGLPAGLAVDALTGVLSGTPSAIRAAASYTIAAKNSGGSTTAAITITVNDVAPSNLSYSTMNIVGTKGLPLVASRPALVGGAATYSVNVPLPPGITLDPATGVISGTPTAVYATAAYAITARNSGGASSAPITITVNEVAPNALAYKPASIVATKGSPIIPSTPSVQGGPTESFTVGSTLPAGLLLNATTGVISGTPSALQAAKSYSITAKNSGGASTATVMIAVNDVAPSGLKYSLASASYSVGKAVAANSPSASGGPIVSYSVNPALPAGLVLNPTTGVLSGTPTAAKASTSYSVTGVNSGGSAMAKLTIAVAAAPSPTPSPVASPTPLPTAMPSSAPAAGGSQNINLTVLADSEDFTGPGRGAEIWHSATSASVSYPTATSGFQAQDLYYRFAWAAIETGNGVYNWPFFDDLINRAIDAGQKFGFGVMTACPGGCIGTVNYSGGESAYPQYLHQQMQAEGVKDWLSRVDSPNWVPNWNSPSYLSNFERLLQAINNHLETTSHKGVLYKNAINYIDIRGYGSWGEWHLGNIVDSEVSESPAGTVATAASLKRIIDAHLDAFPNHQLVGLMGAFSAGWDFIGLFRIPQAVGSYLLTAKNNAGLIGWRRDNWGSNESYLRNMLEGNSLWSDEIMNRYKYAPVNGEPMPGGTHLVDGSDVGRCAYWEMKSQVERYHAASFGNENYAGTAGSACAQDNLRSAFRASGYRIVIRGGSRTAAVAADRKLTVRLDWQNIGLAPSYENWDTLFELRNSGGAAVWSGKSSHVMKLFAPKVDSAGKVLTAPSLFTSVTDTFALPSGVAGGNYTLHLVIRDPNGYRKPFPLAISGRAADGSYPLGGVSVP